MPNILSLLSTLGNCQILSYSQSFTNTITINWNQHNFILLPDSIMLWTVRTFLCHISKMRKLWSAVWLLSTISSICLPKDMLAFIGISQIGKQPATKTDKPQSWQFCDWLVMLNFCFIVKNIIISTNKLAVNLANLLSTNPSSILCRSQDYTTFTKFHFIQVSLKALI